MKKIFIKNIVLVLVGVLLLTGCSNAEKINTPITIDGEDIVITVLSSEKASINDELSLANGEYVKVKVSIENKGKEEYTWNNYTDFALGDEVAAITMQDDELPNKVAAGTTETGYIYFSTTNSKVLTYYSNPKAVSNDEIEVIAYTFNIE